MITVDRRITQGLGPGRARQEPLRIWRGDAPDGERCDSAAIGGGCLLRYDPARPTFGGHTLAIIAASASLLVPLTPAEALAALAELEPGRPAYVHVNSHRVAADRRNGTVSPILAVRLAAARGPPTPPPWRTRPVLADLLPRAGYLRRQGLPGRAAQLAPAPHRPPGRLARPPDAHEPSPTERRGLFRCAIDWGRTAI